MAVDRRPAATIIFLSIFTLFTFTLYLINSHTRYHMSTSELTAVAEEYLLYDLPPSKESKWPSPKKLNKSFPFRHNDSSLYQTVLALEPCNSTDFMHIFVLTTPTSFRHRDIYRQTVLSPISSGALGNVSYSFVIGRIGDFEMQVALEKEKSRHGDILQGNFLDTYDNLSLKSLFILSWAAENCARTKYILKLDDDVFANILNIVNYLQHMDYNKYDIIGSVFDDAIPIYDKRNRWHVTKTYNRTTYPVYVSGTAYVMSAPLLKPLFQAGLLIPMLRLEDIFITGLSAEKTGLPVCHLNFPGFRYGKEYNLAKVDLRKANTIHGLTSKQLQYVWKRLKSLDYSIQVSGQTAHGVGG